MVKSYWKFKFIIFQADMIFNFIKKKKKKKKKKNTFLTVFWYPANGTVQVFKLHWI